MIYPDNFETKTGFAEIRTMLRELCLSPLGQTEADDMCFSSDIEAVNELHAQTNELRLLLEANPDFPLNNIFDARESVSRARIANTHLEESEFFDLRRSLDTVHKIVGLLHPDDPAQMAGRALFRLSDGIAVFPDLVQRIDQVIDKYGHMRDTASPELLRLRRELARAEGSVSRILHGILRSAQAEGLVEKDVSPAVRDGRLVIPIAPGLKRRINGIVHDESATGHTVFVEPTEVVEANNHIRELENEERQEVIRILTALTQHVRPNVAEILDSLHFLGIIDFIQAKVRLGKKLRAVSPVVKASPCIDWIEARHPLLELQLTARGHKIVPLGITLTDEKRILVISGPNAGGKSVCLKTVALLQYMLQCGLPIPIAEDSEAGVFDDIFLDIGDGQNIENDLSTYSSHLQNMKFFVKNATEKTLVAIDEFGSGTEPEMGGAIAQATLEEFCRKRVFGVITTHYTNIKYFAEQTEGVVNGAMLYDRSKLKPLFELKIGQAGSSFALEIAQNIGLPQNIIAAAKQLVGQQAINYDRLTQAAIKNKVYWENKREKIRRRSKEQDEIISQYEAKLSSIEAEKKEIIRQAKMEARQIVDSANATIENAIRTIKESNADKAKTAEARRTIRSFTDDIVPKTEVDKPAAAAFKIADKVVMKGQSVVGEILDISDKKAIVAFGAIKTTVRLSDLEAATGNRVKQTAKAGLSRATTNEIRRRQLNFSQDIDLRGMRVAEALKAVMYYIDDARMANVGQVRILHGTGEGALRQAIREYLSGLSFLKSFGDEHVQLGGAGITVVNL